MRTCAPHELATRSDRKVLDAAIAATPSPWVDLLHGEARKGRWRIVELFSETGRAFNARLDWTGGSGAGAYALVTVSRATRICLFGRSVKVRVQNLANVANTVGVTVADGYAETRNQWEYESPGQEAEEVFPEIPPFAKRFRVELVNPALLPTAEIRVFNGTASLRSHHYANAQPDPGIPIGGADKATVQGAIGGYRVVFELGI